MWLMYVTILRRQFALARISTGATSAGCDNGLGKWQKAVWLRPSAPEPIAT